ncbi:MAG: hypothetical protein KDE51_25685 [Anaerolineales bacterium]|nr:hypothetical protein [Anaerolineales bacterium]
METLEEEIHHIMEDDSTIDVVSVDSGLITFLRTVQQHHVQLSAMADQKASLLIGASFVVMSILFGQLDHGEISIPLLTLGVPTIIACVLAVLAVSPSTVPSKKSTSPGNLLFFGSFSNMDAAAFEKEIEDILTADGQVYRAMIMDIYQLGCVLHSKKYRYLAHSYRVFLVGLVLTFLVMVYTYFTGL